MYNNRPTTANNGTPVREIHVGSRKLADLRFPDLVRRRLLNERSKLHFCAGFGGAHRRIDSQLIRDYNTQPANRVNGRLTVRC